MRYLYGMTAFLLICIHGLSAIYLDKPQFDIPINVESIIEDELSEIELKNFEIETKQLNGMYCIAKKKDIEVVFIIDGSFRLDNNMFVKNFVLEALRMFELEQFNTRVGIIRMKADNVELILSVDDGINHRVVQSTLNSYKDSAGQNMGMMPSKISDALAENTLDKKRKVVIIIWHATGPSEESMGLTSWYLWSMGYVLIIVNIDPGVVRSNDAAKYLNAKTFADLEKSTSELDVYFRDTLKCDPCIPSPCDDTSQCVSSTKGPCTNFGCQNGGFCYLYQGQPRCKCSNHYSGDKCEYEPCHYYYTCHNGGTCLIENCKKKCICPPNYYGADCSMSACQTVNCKNGRTCRIKKNVPTCECANGYDGLDCAITISCGSDSCNNGGKCTVISNSTSCECPTGYSGTRCESIAPVCPMEYCKNGGTCSIISQSQSCDCLHGFYGSQCEMVDPCFGYICGTGGQCLVQANLVPICQCQDGRTASTCETTETLGPCQQNPCKNGCLCVPSCKHEGGFYCKSSQGFVGKTCSIPPPSVECDPNRIRVTIDEALVKELSYNLPTVYLFAYPNIKESNNPVCKVSLAPYSFTFGFPFDECGASIEVLGNGDRVVANTIWLNRRNNGTAFTMPVSIVAFECTYKNTINVVSSIIPTMAPFPLQTKITTTSVQGSMEMCKSASGCPSSCPTLFSIPSDAVYTIGEIMHVIIKSSSNIAPRVLSLEYMYLSCKPSAIDAPSTKDFELVSDGCPANKWHVDVLHNAKQSNSLCAYFRVPQLHACTTVYIHAKLITCLVSETTACSGGNRKCPLVVRGRRAISNASDSGANVFGPIFIMENRKSHAVIELFPEQTMDENELNSEDAKTELFKQIFVIFLASIIVIFVTTCFCYLLYLRRNSKS